MDGVQRFIEYDALLLLTGCRPELASEGLLMPSGSCRSVIGVACPCLGRHPARPPSEACCGAFDAPRRPSSRPRLLDGPPAQALCPSRPQAQVGQGRAAGAKPSTYAKAPLLLDRYKFEKTSLGWGDLAKRRRHFSRGGGEHPSHQLVRRSALHPPEDEAIVLDPRRILWWTWQ